MYINSLQNSFRNFFPLQCSNINFTSHYTCKQFWPIHIHIYKHRMSPSPNLFAMSDYARLCPRSNERGYVTQKRSNKKRERRRFPASTFTRDTGPRIHEDDWSFDERDTWNSAWYFAVESLQA